MTGDIPNKLSLRPEYWRYFAGEAGRGGDCPLYEHVSLAIADDPDIQALTRVARPGQPPANMLFAAVHFMLLGGAEHPLRLYYPHLLKAGEQEAEIGGHTYGVFKDFALRHQADIGALIATRVTNTNEVRRSSYLRAGYAAIAARTGKPLDILELGPSAGLNLNWDRYAYRYTGETVLQGGGASALTIDCEWRGAAPPPVPASHPAVSHRLGLELNAVDLGSEADRRWLVALLWPGLTERIARMKAALAIAAVHPPPIRQGNALALLPEVLERIDPAHTAVIVHSMVIYQWTDAMRAELDALLTAASVRRPIYRLYSEFALEGAATLYPLNLDTYDNGVATREILAHVHHHGAWIEWRA